MSLDAVGAARRVAEQVLRPCAQEVDAGEVPRSHLRAIARAGLLGLNGPLEAGGSAVSSQVFREVVEVLAGADCSTWFVQAQHHSPLAMLARSSEARVRERLLEPLSSGRLLAGVAFSHLRRPDRPVTATRVDGGWRFDGVAPWYTGWGLNDVMLLGGATVDGSVVFAFVDAVPSAQVSPSAPLATAALAATATVRLRIDGLVLGDECVVTVAPFTEWAAADRRTTVNVSPAVFGLAGSAVALLGESGSAAARSYAEVLGARLATARTRSYGLIDSREPDEAGEERLAAKADALALMLEATQALVAAGAGGAMALTSPAQRLAREALFLLVQGQTREVREATLARWAATRSGGL